MKRIISAVALSGIVVLSTSRCAIGPVGGLVYTSTKFAGEVNPANDVPATKEGIGCQKNVLSLVTWGNAGAGDVARANGIERIATIDHSHTNVLFIYRDYCTIVRGN